MALRDVNLVPQPVLHRRYVIRHITAWALAYLFLIGCGVGSYVAHDRVVNAGGPAADEEHLRRNLALAIAEIQGKAKEIEQMTLIRRMSRSSGVTRALDHLAASMDPQTWLTDFSFQMHDGSGATLVLTGLSASNTRVGSLLEQLSRDRMFASVSLRNSAEAGGRTATEGQPADLISFIIQAEVRAE